MQLLPMPVKGNWASGKNVSRAKSSAQDGGRQGLGTMVIDITERSQLVTEMKVAWTSSGREEHREGLHAVSPEDHRGSATATATLTTAIDE